MYDSQHRTVPLPGRSIHCLVIEGTRPGPTFVLLHGMFGSGEYNWGPYAQQVAKYGRVIIPDLRGHGSSKHKGPWLLQDATDDIVELCKALDVHRTVPVGLSLGGAIAQLLWQKNANLVSGYVLALTAAKFPVNLPGRLAIEDAEKIADSSPDVLRKLPLSAKLGEIVAGHYLGSEGAHPVWTFEQLPMMLQIAREASRFNALSFARTISVPTDVIAIEGDEVVGTKNSVALAKLIPGARLQLLPKPKDGLSPHRCPERGTKDFASALLRAANRIASEVAE